ncbi:hypothetical protein fHyEco03_gp73 [Escherichia phage vB_EcoM_fHy-Eco03]|nr:hypothetical protein fHyEco03_gp73 [Escherichia phage vB_EcoM_fHy-Eco03]
MATSKNAARWEAFFERTSPEELLEDLEEIKTMLTDIMLPAIFNKPKKNTIARNLLKKAIAEKKYKRKLTTIVMLNALKWPQPYQWLYGTFRDLMDAITEESNNESEKNESGQQEVQSGR